MSLTEDSNNIALIVTKESLDYFLFSEIMKMENFVPTLVKNYPLVSETLSKKSEVKVILFDLNFSGLPEKDTFLQWLKYIWSMATINVKIPT